jgi:hypothetical protein
MTPEPAAPSKSRRQQADMPRSLSDGRGGCTLPLDGPGIAQFIEMTPESRPLCTPPAAKSKMSAVGHSVPIDGVQLPGCGDLEESKPCPVVAPKLPMVNPENSILSSPTATIDIDSTFKQMLRERTDDSGEDASREETERLAYSIPPASRPGPNMHAELWRRPHPDSAEAEVMERQRAESPDAELWQCPRADSPEEVHRSTTTMLTRSHHIRLLKNQSLQQRTRSRKPQERCSV